MKFKAKILLIFGALAATVGFLLSFAATENYNILLIVIAAIEILAIAGIFFGVRRGRGWMPVRLLFGLISAYTLLDVVLRGSCGVRVLDILF
jgi:hypothetical protein